MTRNHHLMEALEQVRNARLTLEGGKVQEKDREEEVTREILEEEKKEELGKSEIDRVAMMATEYECSKASKHAILHAIFDLALNAKQEDLKKWAQTGQIYTRDGPNNWIFDPKSIRNERGYSLLHVAVAASSVKEVKKMPIVRYLIEELNWDPNEIDLMGRTPLHIAVISGYKTIISYLLEHGASSERQDRAGLTPLSLALSLSRPKEGVVQSLLRYVPKGQNVPSLKSVLCPTRKRQQLHYVLLMKSSTASLDGTLTVTKNKDICISSCNVGHFCSSGELVEIGGTRYYCAAYDAETRTLKLDRPYSGPTATRVSGIVHQYASVHPPYFRFKTILADVPGNQFEQNQSPEQELVQHSQFLDPNSQYEVAMKMGPLSKEEGKMMLAEWKKVTAEQFQSRTCISKCESCKFECPQKSGHAMCVYSMMAAGKALAKQKLRRGTYAKAVTSTAVLQQKSSNS